MRERIVRADRKRGERKPAQPAPTPTWIGSNPEYSPELRRFREFNIRTGDHCYNVADEGEEEIVSESASRNDGPVYLGEFVCVYRKSDGRVFRRLAK